MPGLCDKGGQGSRPLHETTPPQCLLSLQCDPNLVIINARLPAYQEALDAQVDAWLIIRVPDPTCVYKWRLEAEEKQKARGKPGMTEEQVHDFVDRQGWGVRLEVVARAALAVLEPEGHAPESCNKCYGFGLSAGMTDKQMHD